MKTVVVMPVGPGRQENMLAALECIEEQLVRPEGIVIVHDGPDAYEGKIGGASLPIVQCVLPEPHQPGHEQPRNLGVRYAADVLEFDHAWFLDSDVIVQPDCYMEFEAGHIAADENRILVGPYDWLDPGTREPQPELHNDPRWVSFSKQGPEDVRREDIGAGLACFSGNLIWPVKEFTEVGGFWNEIHHGRCEDGELGLRATALGVPISLVPKARGWHLWHPVNVPLAEERNARDVPMLNARHPWVEGEGLEVVPQDGRRFNCRCPKCNESINTIEWWTHIETCGREPDPDTIIPGAMP